MPQATAEMTDVTSYATSFILYYCTHCLIYLWDFNLAVGTKCTVTARM
jgi:hypothetical protein